MFKYKESEQADTMLPAHLMIDVILQLHAT